MRIETVNRSITEELAFYQGHVTGLLRVEDNKPHGVTINVSKRGVAFNVSELDDVIAVLQAIKAKAAGQSQD